MTGEFGMEENRKLTLNDNISYLGLSTRVYTSLYRAGIKDINSLIHRNVSLKAPYERPHLLLLRNLGKTSLKEIVDKVHENGFVFMDEDGFEEMIERHEKALLDELKSGMNNDKNSNEMFNEEMLHEFISKQSEENKTIIERIERKSTLLIEYERLMKEKRTLVLREKAIDFSLMKLSQELNKMGVNSDDRRKK